MDFRIEEKIDAGAGDVLVMLRDRLVELVPYLDGIKSIEVAQRKAYENGDLDLLNIWQANIDTVPTAARPFISEETLRWKDVASWRGYSVSWKLEPFKFGNLFDCSGVNSVEAASDKGSRLVISGTLNVHPDKLPGVPFFLAKRLRPEVEKVVVAMITPNLRGVADGLNRYFSGHPKA